MLGVIGTLAVILPAFLTGAMAVQIRDDLNMSEWQLGLAIGSFFVGSAAGSTLLGRLAERLGPRLAIRLGLAASIAANIVIAAFVQGHRSLIAVLAVAGLANALTQPAVNLLLVRVVEPGRLGTVMALKQSGMPAAALVGGLAVPLIALTVGWRAGYLLAALIALSAVVLTGVLAGHGEVIAESTPSNAAPDSHERPRPDLGMRTLLLMAAVGVLGGGAANILVGYLVSGAVAAGVSPGPAGLLLTMGAALGIASRLIQGWMADKREFDVLARVIVLFAVGSMGAAGLALQSTTGYLLATPFAFAAGWAWPGLFNLVVVRTNRSAPAAATGITQTGVYLGSLVGPVVAGLLVEKSGYPAVWLMTAGALAGASLLALAVKRALVPQVLKADGPQVEQAGTTG